MAHSNSSRKHLFDHGSLPINRNQVAITQNHQAIFTITHPPSSNHLITRYMCVSLRVVCTRTRDAAARGAARTALSAATAPRNGPSPSVITAHAAADRASAAASPAAATTPSVDVPPRGPRSRAANASLHALAATSAAPAAGAPSGRQPSTHPANSNSRGAATLPAAARVPVTAAARSVAAAS